MGSGDGDLNPRIEKEISEPSLSKERARFKYAFWLGNIVTFKKLLLAWPYFFLCLKLKLLSC